MKKIAIYFVALLLTICILLTATGFSIQASSYTSGHFTYTVEDGEAIITDYSLSGDKDVVIPSELGGYPVTVVGFAAFRDKELTAVTIPDSVTIIGDRAFFGNRLETLDIGNSVKRIGSFAFAVNYLSSVTIPDSVTHIDDGVFSRNSLEEVVIGSSVTLIGERAFSANQLNLVKIPDSVTDIDALAFAENLLTKAIIYGEDVSFDGDEVFSYNPIDLKLHGYRESAIEAYANANNHIFLPPYTITAEVQPVNSGTVTGDGSYLQGSEATLIASEKKRFTFANWTENGTEVSTSTTHIFNVTGDRDLVANFERLVSSDADLSGLVVDPGKLEPDFDPQTTAYTVDVAHATSTIEVTATLSDEYANMTIDGEAATSGEAKEVTLGAAGTETVINVVITAEDDSTAKTYTVAISRAEKEDPIEEAASVGLYDPGDGVFHIIDKTPYRYGPRYSSWRPLAGDWNGDGSHKAGLYDSSDGVFHLEGIGPYRYGPRSSVWLPLAGDWNGDGNYKAGLYDPSDGVFHLKGQEPFRYGPRSSVWLPLAGDWNGNGTYSVGLYDSSDGIFHLEGIDPYRYGPRSSVWLPLAGKWDGDGNHKVGLYDSSYGAFHLEGLKPYRYGPRLSGWYPLAGIW